MVGDDFAWIKGGHTWQFGGTFKDILAHDTDCHRLQHDRDRAGWPDPWPLRPQRRGLRSGNPSLRPADIDPNNPNPPGTRRSPSCWAALAMCRATTTTTLPVLAEAAYGRSTLLPLLSDPALCAGHVEGIPSLTLTYGVTYQLFSVPYETRGLESMEPFTFDQYMQARVKQSNLSQSGPDAVPLIAYYLGGKGNGSSAPPLYPPEYRNFAPHFGFAWNPSFDKKMVFNGSAGIVYDRTVVSCASEPSGRAFLSLPADQARCLQGIADDRTIRSRTIRGLTPVRRNAITALTAARNAEASLRAFRGDDWLPVVTAPCGLLNGLAFNTTIDPSLKTPYTSSSISDSSVSLPQTWF